MPARHTLRSLRARLLAAAVVVGVTAPAALADQPGPLDDVVPPGASSRMPVVLTGAQLPGWSSPPATGVANPYPSGSSPRFGPLPPGDGVRDAHNGTLVPSEDTWVPTAATVENVAAFRYENDRWVEIRPPSPPARSSAGGGCVR